jgi:predicted GNAT superfamily acetyltransferase
LDGIQVDQLRGVAQAREVERLQMEIWGTSPAWIVPSHALLIVSEYGGILLGARAGDKLVGFVLGFLARADGKLFHASHMLGVLPAFQHHGIGAALKWRQRNIAREQGLDLIRWTFDPLESRNAYLNFHKLGTVCGRYRADYYGPMPDSLNRDLPSDRLLVDWHVRDEDRRTHAAGAPVPILRNREGSPELQTDGLPAGGPVAIEIPRDMQTIKHETPDLALSWRLAVRQAFSQCFGQGYVACDFRDSAYILMPSEAGNED